MASCRIYTVKNLKLTELPKKLEDYEEEWEDSGLKLRKVVENHDIGKDGSGWFDFWWDTVGHSEFHGEKSAYGRTHHCKAWFDLGSSGTFYLSARWRDQEGGRDEIVKMLLKDYDDMERIAMTPEHLRDIIAADSIRDKLMWWWDVADDCDGALRGNLRGGLRDRFDERGRPYYDMFDSENLNAVVKIATRYSSISSAVDEEDLVQYIKDVILPIVRP